LSLAEGRGEGLSIKGKGQGNKAKWDRSGFWAAEHEGNVVLNVKKKKID